MLAPALAALALASAGPRLEAAAAMGAGYDSNLNHAPPSGSAVGSTFTAARASGGASLDLGRATGLYAGLRLDLEQYRDVSDLTSGSAGAEAALVQDLGKAWAIVLAPSMSRSWSTDGARDATILSGQLTLRVKPVAGVALRTFYARTGRSAVDPVFSSVRDRVGASAEWRPFARTYLSLSWAAERGGEVFYRSIGGGGMPGMGGRMVTAFGENQEAYRATAEAQALTPAVEVGLGGRLHLQASYELRAVRSDAADFTTHSAFVGVGFRT